MYCWNKIILFVNNIFQLDIIVNIRIVRCNFQHHHCAWTENYSSYYSHGISLTKWKRVKASWSKPNYDHTYRNLSGKIP